VFLSLSIVCCSSPHRKREKELLVALEGVIQRCQELEQAQFLYQQHQEQQLPPPPRGAVAMTSLGAMAAQLPRRMLNNEAPASSAGFTGSNGSAAVSTPAAAARPSFAANTRASMVGTEEKLRSSGERSRSRSVERRQSRAWH
jgi:hypothetical protein